jgi:hypothetical protein
MATRRELNSMLMRAYGTTTAFRMLDINAKNPREELVAAKETALILEAQLMRLCLEARDEAPLKDIPR